MEVKKHKRYDLENYRSVFFLVGLVFALATMYAMFQYKTYNAKAEDFAINDESNFEQEDIPITRNDVELPPPPKHVQALDQIDIVDNNEKLKDIFEFPTIDEEDTVIFVDPFQTEEEPIDDMIFVSVEKKPVFPGGNDALRAYIAKHIQYPTAAKEKDIEGIVVVKFVVGTNGEVSNVSILRGVDPLLDSEAVRVVKTLPKFKPGMQQGRAVKVWFTLPIVFKLQR